MKKLDEEIKSPVEENARSLYNDECWVHKERKSRTSSKLDRVSVSEFKPVDPEKVSLMRQIRTKENHMYAILREMSLYLVFTAVVFSIGYISRDTHAYNQTRDIEDMFRLKRSQALSKNSYNHHYSQNNYSHNKYSHKTYSHRNHSRSNHSLRKNRDFADVSEIMIYC